MRRPSTEDELYAWHRYVMGDARGYQPAGHHPEDPQCGWYMLRLTKGGPWVPMQIECVQVIDPETGELTEPERLVCTMLGQVVDPGRYWARGHFRHISESDYQSLETEWREAERQGKHHPMLDPFSPVDVTARPTAPRAPRSTKDDR